MIKIGTWRFSNDWKRLMPSANQHALPKFSMDWDSIMKPKRQKLEICQEAGECEWLLREPFLSNLIFFYLMSLLIIWTWMLSFGWKITFKTVLKHSLSYRMLGNSLTMCAHIPYTSTIASSTTLKAITIPSSKPYGKNRSNKWNNTKNNKQKSRRTRQLYRNSEPIILGHRWHNVEWKN